MRVCHSATSAQVSALVDNLATKMAACAAPDRVAASVYGVGKLATGHHGAHDIAILIVGLAAGALGAIVAVRRHRKHTTQRRAAAGDGPPHKVP